MRRISRLLVSDEELKSDLSRACSKVPNLTDALQHESLLNHLISTGDERWRQGQTKLLCRPKIYGQWKLRREFNR
jgi:hypothetical protein